MKIKAVPADTETGAITTKFAAVEAVTLIALLAPPMLLVVLSVAVKVWLPAVFKMALKVPTPLVRPAIVWVNWT